jgi:cell division protein FtsL
VAEGRRRKCAEQEIGMKSNSGTIRLALCFALLVGALTMVIWRQSQAFETLRALDKLRDNRALAEAERSELSRKIEHLESRAVVVASAGQMLGMRVPSATEIVILPLQAPRARPASGSNIAMSGAQR